MEAIEQKVKEIIAALEAGSSTETLKSELELLLTLIKEKNKKSNTWQDGGITYWGH